MIVLNNPKEVNLILLGQPLAKQSARFTTNGNKFSFDKQTGRLKKSSSTRVHIAPKYKEKAKSYKLQIKQQLPQGFQPFKGRVVVERLVFVLKPTKAMLASKERKELFNNGMGIPHTKRPDLSDNLPKLIFDCLSGLVYSDDSLVCHEKDIFKVYGLNPRVEITLKGEQEIFKAYDFIDIEKLGK